MHNGQRVKFSSEHCCPKLQLRSYDVLGTAVLSREFDMLFVVHATAFVSTA